MACLSVLPGSSFLSINFGHAARTGTHRAGVTLLLGGQPFPALVPKLQAPVELINAAEAELTKILMSLHTILRGIHFPCSPLPGRANLSTLHSASSTMRSQS